MTPERGDFFVERGEHWFGKVIRFVTRSDVNHAGIYIGDNKIAESLSAGAVVSPLHDGLIWSTMPLSSQQRAEIVRQAYTMLGIRYAWIDVICLGLVQYHIKLPGILRRLDRRDRLFCSELVDETYNKAGIHLFDDGRKSLDVTPGDLHRLILA